MRVRVMRVRVMRVWVMSGYYANLTYLRRVLKKHSHIPTGDYKHYFMLRGMQKWPPG